MNYKIINLVFCTILFYSISYSQEINELDSIISKYNNSKLIEIDSIIKSYKNDTNKYLNLLPSINVGYVPNTSDINISVGVSLSNFTNFLQNENRNKIELQKLKIQLLQKLNNDILKLQIEALEIINIKNELNQLAINLKLKKDFFYIKLKQFQNQKINLENYLLEQEKYNNTLFSCNRVESKLHILLTRFLSKTNTQPYELRPIENRQFQIENVKKCN